MKSDRDGTPASFGLDTTVIQKHTNGEQMTGSEDKQLRTMITILGPTAGGKTRLAALTAHALDGEVLSADSRQVYKGMDIGTGKDLDDYVVEGQSIPVHLVDLAEAGTRFSVFDYLLAFNRAFDEVTTRGKTPVLCGGSGLYLEAVIMRYRFVPAPPDQALRAELANVDFETLKARLASLKTLHNQTDFLDRPTLIRAIEVASYERRHPEQAVSAPRAEHLVFGLDWPRDLLRKKIRTRLRDRLDQGLVEEVRGLLDRGVDPDVLDSYGLEYRFVLRHLRGELDKTQLMEKLAQAIGKFAKRQSTWFRRMERRGCPITWLDGRDGPKRNLDKIREVVETRRKP